MKVWIAIHGEQYHGYGIVGVFSTKEAAVAAALGTKTSFEGGWIKDEDEDFYWDNGCDFVSVCEWEVE